ncbi:MAG TPA: hypothetical protein DCR24_06830 [Bacillus bacterium]|nr:hypothetical protein [Bacillus sp. (in: firmicutes)]
MDTNEELKEQLKNLSSDESKLDLNKIMKFTENLVKEQSAKSQFGKEEDLEETSLKGLSSLVKEENLDSIMKMAKNLVNPTTLSLLSKTNGTSENKQAATKEISNLKLSVERLSDELEKARKESEELKLQWKDLKSQYLELHNRYIELEYRFSELENKISSLRRRRR